jgi:tRNA modification GTPase
VNPGDTIAASAAGLARAPRGILRLSGPGTAALLARLGVPAPDVPGCRCVRLQLPATGATPSAPATLPLPALLLRFVAPRSCTGEDAAELLIPGNPLLIDRLLSTLVHLGVERVREAEPGEFSARAYLHGKLTLAQAEGVAMTIAADSAQALAAARAAASGESGARYADWSDRAAHLLALVEAGIDFADQEDVVPIAGPVLAARAKTLAEEILSATGTPDLAPPRAAREADADPLPVALLWGAPNAGKSTLFNALLGRPRALASPTPGTTRDLLAEPLALPDGARLLLTDAPGAADPGPGTDPLDRAARARARDAAAAGHASIIIWCDPTGRFLPEHAPPASTEPAPVVLRVRTQADRPPLFTSPVPPRSPTPPTPPAASTIEVCALDGRGLPALLEALGHALATAAPGPPGLLPRHRRAFRRAAGQLALAAELASADAAGLARPELIAAALREALDALSELTGRLDPDAIIGRVFATFCIGK